MKKKSSSLRLLYILAQMSYWFIGIIGLFIVGMTIKGLVSGDPILPSELGERLSYNYSLFENNVDLVMADTQMEELNKSKGELPGFIKGIIWLHPIFMISLIFLMAHYFRRLVVQVYKGVYFADICIKSLKSLSLILFISWGYDLISSIAIKNIIGNYFSEAESYINITVGTPSIYLLVAALFVWALSIIFQEGLSLKEENELTV